MSWMKTLASEVSSSAEAIAGALAFPVAVTAVGATAAGCSDRQRRLRARPSLPAPHRATGSCSASAAASSDAGASGRLVLGSGLDLRRRRELIDSLGDALGAFGPQLCRRGAKGHEQAINATKTALAGGYLSCS